jgi:hypothetical protein
MKIEPVWSSATSIVRGSTTSAAASDARSTKTTPGPVWMKAGHDTRKGSSRSRNRSHPKANQGNLLSVFWPTILRSRSCATGSAKDCGARMVF